MTKTSATPTRQTAALRAALGPGIQFGGPSELVLRTVTRTPARRH